MITATRVHSGLMRGDAVLWRLSEPIHYYKGSTEYVITSRLPFETYIFPADDAGNVINWSELPGSLKGSWLHEHAIAEAGWVIA